MRKLTFTLSLTLTIFFSGKSQSWQTEMDSVLTLLAQQEMFHGQLLIERDGQIRFHKAYGNDISKVTPLPIESVTKAFTAIGILVLEGQGKLKLTDHLTRYFPDLPYPEVTLLQLMNMRSGLPRFLETAMQYGDTSKVMTNPEIISLAEKHQPKAGKPDTEFKYNNTNYLLLASIIEKVSGMSYAHFVERHLITPLGLDNTSVRSASDLVDGNEVNRNNFYQAYGEGNIVSTAEDLYKLNRALTKNGYLSFYGKFSKYLSIDDIPNYWMGWWLKKDNAELKMRIVGDGTGSRTLWQRSLSGGESLFYLHVESVAYQEAVFQVIESVINGNDYTLPTKRVLHVVDEELLKTYVGQYLSDVFGLLHITLDQGKLYLRPNPVPDSELLVPSSDSTFFFEGQPVEWEFFKDEKGKVIGLGFKDQPETMGKKQ